MMNQRNRMKLCAVFGVVAIGACCIAKNALVIGITDINRRPANIAQTFYIDAVEKAGHVPLMIGTCTDSNRLAKVVERIDVLLLAGGADVETARYGEPNRASFAPDLRRDAFEFALLDLMVKARKPVLGICRGMQLLNIYFGGSLYQDIDKEAKFAADAKRCNHRVGKWEDDAVNPPAHCVLVEPDSRLYAVTGTNTLWVNSHHHQALNRIAAGWRISGRAPDGIVEAFECDVYPAAGLQFHPEALIMCNPPDKRFQLDLLIRIFSDIDKFLCNSK